MTRRRLGAAIGRAVAAHHVGGAVAEQMLDIELAGVVGDPPGGEGVPEAMGVDAGDVLVVLVVWYAAAPVGDVTDGVSFS